MMALHRALLLVLFLSSSIWSQNSPPNILFVFTDDHASHAIGAYGSKLNSTPQIDRLAKGGMRFDNCFCTNSICAPSRAVILTGKHSHLNGVMTNREIFDGSQVTFPKLLQSAGYQTALFGKWHLKSPLTGFDDYEVLQGQGPYYNPEMKTPEGKRKHVGYTTDIVTDLALQWLQSGRDEDCPFLLMVQHKAPHRAWYPGPKYLNLYDDVQLPEPPTLFDDYTGRSSAARSQEMTIAEHLSDHDLKLAPPRGLTEDQLKAWDAAYGPKNEVFWKAGLVGKDLVRWKYQRYVKDYLRCIASVDENVGRLLDHLDESGLAANTLVVYSSDQGFYLGDHGWYDKRWMYEESLRMPLLMRWPGITRPGSVAKELVQNLDFAQTFLAAAGARIPDDMQGRSLLPVLRGKAPGWREAIYYHYWEYPGAHAVRRHFGVRTGTHKLIHYYGIDEWELFDLEKDPLELDSRHADGQYAAVRVDLEQRLERLRTQYGEGDPARTTGERGQARLRGEAARVRLTEVLRLPEPASVQETPDPTGRPITVGARVRWSEGSGVIFAQGGASYGYSLYVRDGKPCFSVRNEGLLRQLEGTRVLEAGTWTLVTASVGSDGRLYLKLDGKPAGDRDGLLLGEKPAEGISVGADTGSPVGAYPAPFSFTGELRDIRLYWGLIPEADQEAWGKAR